MQQNILTHQQWHRRRSTDYQKRRLRHPQIDGGVGAGAAGAGLYVRLNKTSTRINKTMTGKTATKTINSDKKTTTYIQNEDATCHEREQGHNETRQNTMYMAFDRPFG